jgi:hypothetical protein
MLVTAIFVGMAIEQCRGAEEHPEVIVYLNCDPRVPIFTVARATSESSRLFGTIGSSVRYRTGHKREGNRTVLELDLYIQMETPSAASREALAFSHPYRSDGQIRVFYSRVEDFCKPGLRHMVLAYILTHEVTHSLSGVLAHSPTGIMKAKWDLDDFRRIRTGKLEFDPADIKLLQIGIGLRARDAR